MKILIVGAGQVGTDIAASLCDSHNVTVVDRDPEMAEAVEYNVDALGVEGDGTRMDVLEEAGVTEADVVVASTDDDEANIVVCGTAKAVSDAFTIARVEQSSYLKTWEKSPGALGVGYMVAKDHLTSEKTVRIIGTPAARDVDVFSEGKVHMAEFDIEESSPIAGQTVSEADRFPSLTFAAIIREGEVEIPSGSTRMEESDRVVVIGSPESVHTFAIDISPEYTPDKGDDVVVFGGGDIGEGIARLLGERGFRPRLVESDGERARQLAESLPNTTVLESDATDQEFLEGEGIGRADVIVGALDSDEKNLLSSLLARTMGADRTVAIVENSEYVELFELVGVDVAVNPREVVAEEITRLTRETRTENVALVGDEAEVIEIEVDDESILAGRTLRESDADLPDGVVFGAISRGVDFISPRGGTVVEKGDHVVVFVDAEVHDEVVGKL